MRSTLTWKLATDISKVKKDKQLNLLDNGIKVYFFNVEMGKPTKLLFFRINKRDFFYEQVDRQKKVSERAHAETGMSVIINWDDRNSVALNQIQIESPDEFGTEQS